MQGGMLIHIPMSRKPININIHNMAKSEVYNTDCIEYMRTLPDNHFDIAVCDPPYGHGNDESLLGGGRGSDSDSSGISANRFHRGGVFEKYHKTLRGMVPEILHTSADGTGSKEDGGRDIIPPQHQSIGGGANQKPLHGMWPRHKSSLTSCFVSAEIR